MKILTSLEFYFFFNLSDNFSEIAQLPPAMAARLDNYLKALLALSGDKQLKAARNGILRNMHNDELVELVSHSVSREFDRGNLEEIAAFLLDVIANDPATARASSAHAAERSIRVESEKEGCVPATRSSKGVYAS